VRERFEEIYRTGEWGCGSGEGSAPKYTRKYVAFLQRFLRERAIRTVADFGCGDWQFSRRIDWSGIEYRGYDIVSAVIEANRERFATENVRFELIDGEGSEVPAADLILVKDVFQHWSNARILEFLPEMSRFRYALVTNCIAPSGPTTNRDIADGDYRPLDIRRPPFGVEASEVLRYWAGPRALLPWRESRRTLKSVVMVDG